MKYVLWSGGYDSTYVLLDLLKNSSEENPVTAISINHVCLDKKQYKLECITREKIKRQFKKDGYHLLHRIINISSNMNVQIVDNSLAQPFMWSTSVLSFLTSGDELYFGYIKKDDFWHIKHEFNEMIFGIAKAMQKEIAIFYPLEYILKEDIIKELGKYANLCWTCDEPIKNKQCGKCYKCKEAKWNSINGKKKH